MMKRKISLYSIMFALLLFIPLSTSPVFAEAFEYKDHSENHTYPTEAIEELVEVYSFDDDYDANEVQKMIDRLEVIPANIIEESVKYGARLAMIDFNIPQLEGFTDLAGEHPRGHEDHITWEDMFGIARGMQGVTTIGYTFPRDYQGSVQLDYHEFFHVVSFIMLGEVLTDLDEFIAIHEEEKDKLVPGDDYYEYIEEYFAEAAAFYYRGGDYREQLKSRTPKTYHFFAELADRLIAIDDIGNTALSLSWPENKDVTTYHIYRDGEQIDSVDEANYTDKSYNAYALHRYTITGENSDGEIIYESLPRNISTESNDAVIIANLDGVQVVEETENSITLEWEDVATADYYEIYRDERYIGETYEPYYDDFVFASETTFTYVIRAINYQEEYAEFNPVTATTLEATEAIGEDPPPDWPGFSDDIVTTDNKVSPMVITIIIGVILLVILGFFIALGVIIYFVVKKNRRKHDNDKPS